MLAMTVEDNRLAHLRAIVDAEAAAAGGKPRDGYRAVATATGLGEEYIYQLYKGHKKVIGADAARSLARAYKQGRSDDWFDLPAMAQPVATEEEEMRPVPNIGELIIQLGAIVATLNSMGRASIAPLVAKVMENPDLAREAAAMAEAIASAQRLDLKDVALGRTIGKAHATPVESDFSPLTGKRS